MTAWEFRYGGRTCDFWMSHFFGIDFARGGINKPRSLWE